MVLPLNQNVLHSSALYYCYYKKQTLRRESCPRVVVTQFWGSQLVLGRPMLVKALPTVLLSLVRGQAA